MHRLSERIVVDFHSVFFMGRNISEEEKGLEFGEKAAEKTFLHSLA